MVKSLGLVDVVLITFSIASLTDRFIFLVFKCDTKEQYFACYKLKVV